ncbi:hypothetical protein MD484_g5956, partial [Candolleomyces efflorescens]
MPAHIPSILPTAPVNLTGSGPLLSPSTCRECFDTHLNPVFLTFTDVPSEVVERIMGDIANPLEFQRLSRVCSRFRALAMYIMYSRVQTLLARFGIVSDREFMRYLYREGIYVAGPRLLPVLFPDFHCTVYERRLELHVHNSATVISALFDRIRGFGYALDAEYEGARRVESFASDELGYPHFGRTVKRIVCFTMRINGELMSIVVFISKSEITGFLSIAEYPTTLFMIYVDGINIHVLYPYLTGHRRGLINLPFPQPRNSDTPSFVRRIAHFFDCQSRLVAWPEYRFHICEQNVYCPLRLRHQMDNRGSYLGCSLDHPDMRPYRQRDPTRRMPRPEQDASHRGLYVARDMYIMDPVHRA